ncbi:MAG: NADPH-dependent 7-cyano-7-deazaguanine reductase QueF [Rhodocyclaceae bacterium]|nr:NADPH-dependent 7-cyano-7-deazaguanine reductase QueF [Rhodocyclaceae bacterium]
MPVSESAPPLTASPLGRPVAYRSPYAPELLFPIARAPKRAELGILRDPPFFGVDLWNAYELSWLNPRGKPVVAIGSFHVPASSPRLVESKSLKLYLNSLNGSRFASAEEVRVRIADDLSAAVGARVGVTIEPLSGRPSRRLAEIGGEVIDDIDVAIDTYRPQPAFLGVAMAAPPLEETLVSHLLKSNCLITGQPDWATVAIRYRGRPIDRAGLLRYVVSYRDHDEFHEQCVERIFIDVHRQCRPESLAVWARYTRRGGIDINPFRADAEDASPPGNFGDIRQ